MITKDPIPLAHSRFNKNDLRAQLLNSKAKVPIQLHLSTGKQVSINVIYVDDQTDLIPSNHPTVLKDMPFMGRSLYKDCFKGLQSPPAQSFKASGIFR